MEGSLGTYYTRLVESDNTHRSRVSSLACLDSVALLPTNKTFSSLVESNLVILDINYPVVPPLRK